MPAFTPPTAQNLVDWCGINTAILGDDPTGLSNLLTSLISLAQAEVALEVTETKFNSTSLTTSQVTVLQQAVAYHAAASFLVAPAVQFLTGSQQPLKFESGTSLDETARMLQWRAQELSTLFAIGGDLSQRSSRAAINAMRGAGR